MPKININEHDLSASTNAKKNIIGIMNEQNVDLNANANSNLSSFDHNRLYNRNVSDQHSIDAITGLRSALISKLDAQTAMPLIEEAVQNKAKGLYYDAMKELDRKSYWYLTAEIDPITKMGTKESIISGPYDLGMGGGGSGGGGGSLTTVNIEQLNWPNAVVVGNAETSVDIIWSSTKGENLTPTGNGTIYVTINGKKNVIVLPNKAQGIVPLKIAKYLVSGNNIIQVEVLDAYGTKGITIGTLNAVDLKLESKFDATIAYQGTISYTYIPYGDVYKRVEFYIDNQLHGTQEIYTTGETQIYLINGLTHGAHSLDVRFFATVGEDKIPSNTLHYEIIYFQKDNTTPIIASAFNNFEQEQYISFNIPYRVYIYGREYSQVERFVNGVKIDNTPIQVNQDLQYWNYRGDTPGICELKIVCGSVSKTFNIQIKKSTLNVTPVTVGLEVALSAYGRSNTEEAEHRRTWTFKPSQGAEQSCILNNFNWSSNGWVLDDDGNTVLRVSGDATVEIPYEACKTDFKYLGKTIELEIATKSVRNYDATIISCLDKEKSAFFTVESFLANEETRAKGFQPSISYATISNAELGLGEHVFTYKEGQGWMREDDIVNLSDYGILLTEITVNPDGVASSVVMPGDRIIIKHTLESRGFYLTPQLAAIRSQQSFLSTQYKEDEHVRISFVIEQQEANRIIWMYLNGIASGAMQYPINDTFEQREASNIIIGTPEAVVDIYNIRIYDTSLTSHQIINNWIADTQNAALRAERYTRNQLLNEKNEIALNKLVENFSEVPYIIWDIDPLPEYKGDKRPGNVQYVDLKNSERNFTAINAEYNVQGTSSAVYPTKNIRIKYSKASSWYDENDNDISKFPITYPNGIGDDYFTYKVDFASSEGANNVELVRLYDNAAKKYGILTPPQRLNANVRVGIDGFPIIAFHQDVNGNIKFCTKANFNNDKANEDVYGFADGDESWEITNNSAAETKFQTAVNQYNFGRGFEIRFPDTDGYNNLDKLAPMTAWIESTYRAQATGNLLNEDGSSVTFTYNETIKAEDGSFSSITTTKQFDHDTEEYRLTKFKAELADWFDVDSTLFYYLFTSLFLMIDSRAKNAFPTYFKSRTTEGEAGDGQPAADGGNRWFWLPYDMDTAIGIDNKGKLTFDYCLEDIDQLDGADVYNGQDSVMWTNVRDAFPGELAEMYATLRTQGLISYENVESMFEEHQSKWPEVVFNADSHNKYIVPLLNGNNYLEMLQGSKAEQRKWWLYNRFKYIDSKYNAGDAKADFIQFRAYVGANEEKPDVILTPYANIYATVSFGNGAQNTVSRRVLPGERNTAITIENPFTYADEENDQETYIYSASQLKSIGDISGFHPDTVKIGNAIRLQELKVGDASPTYQNTHLRELTMTNNPLLKKLDARNCVNLGTGVTVAPDLSKCPNIEEIYFDGTKIKGITLPDGGNIKVLHLPGTLTSLTIQNQPLLTDLVIEDTNTTITRSVDTTGGHDFDALVVKKSFWDSANANADIFVADSTDPDAPQIKVSIANKALYDEIVELVSILHIRCTRIDIRFDLLENDEVQLAEYATRFVQKDQTGLTENSPNVTEFLNSIMSQITEPEVAEFSNSLLEKLCLEGIPSSTLQIRKLIKKIKAGATVRLIGIDETVSHYNEITEFYAKLRKFIGDNPSNLTPPPAAQVTGVIHVQTAIPYATYAEFRREQPEVVIDADQIICTVSFKNEGNSHNVQSVKSGSTALTPEIPQKAATQANYYTFSHWQMPSGAIWTEDTVITENLELQAIYDEHIQQYTVIFNTDSDLITADPASQTLDYNTILVEPTLTNIPEGVTLIGWQQDNQQSWNFKTDTLVDNITLTAVWQDGNQPVIGITRESYNKFKVTAGDNLGISAYALVKGTEPPRAIDWIDITPVTSFSNSFSLTSAGNWYFWIRDKNDNRAKAEIIAYSITSQATPGIEQILIRDGDKNIADFAIAGTELQCLVKEDSRYQDLQITLNGEPFVNESKFIANSDKIFDLKVVPKTYTVNFVTGKEALSGVVEPIQSITYNHKVNKPVPQYYKGQIIDAWYTTTDYEVAWNFEEDTVDQEITLYARWVDYHTPTKVKISIPHKFEEWEDAPAQANSNYEDIKNNYNGYTISVNFIQYKPHDIKINFGDGSPAASSATTSYITSVSHTYSEPGDYEVEIFGTSNGYSLGGGFTKQAVDPACCIKDIEFAWDLATTGDYAFKGANISELRLTPYMTSISTAAFAVCRKLTTVSFPKSITSIGTQAFENCTGLTGEIIIPKTVNTVGNNVFANCDNLEQITFEENGELREIGSQFANNSGIKSLVIPHFIQNIKSEAFGNCGQLEKVILMNPDLSMGERVFNSTVKLTSAGPIDWELGAGKNDNFDIEYAWTTMIPANAFSAGVNFRQSYLTEITFPDNLEEIGDYAFKGSAIQEISLPASLKKIGKEAFYYTALLTLDVPSNVTCVGSRAFGFNISLNSAVLRFGGSTTTVLSPQDSWLFGCLETLTPRIPTHLVQKPDMLIEQYGAYWNVYAYNLDTNTIFYLDYTANSD